MRESNWLLAMGSASIGSHPTRLRHQQLARIIARGATAWLGTDSFCG